MIVWWLSARRRARDLDGAGNRDGGARWNSGRGGGVVYTSLNVATCVLETYVHFGPALRARLPQNLVLVAIDVPEDAGIVRIAREQIPADADQPRPDGRSWYQQTGDAWLDGREALVLVAPSAVVPQELNAMLDPAHPRMPEVRIVEHEPFRFDPRLAVGLT